MAGVAALLSAIAASAAAVSAGRYREGRETVPAPWNRGVESHSILVETIPPKWASR